MVNETYYEVFTVAESICFITYFTLVVILGGFGNLFVIYASRCYSSFDLDRVTILFVQHLAIADCSKILFMTIPMLTNHLYYLTHPNNSQWYLPYSVAKLSYFLLAFATNSVGFFIMAVSLHRLARCLSPTRLQQSGIKNARLIMGLLWFLALLFASAVLFLPTSYHMYYTLCSLDITEELSSFLNVFAEYTNFPLLALIFLVVILANATSLIYTFILTKDSPNVNFKQANLTILAISLGMIVCNCWLPYQMIILYYSSKVGDHSPSNIQKYAIPLTTASSLINPILYTVVNKGFKKFAVKVIRRGLGRVTRQDSTTRASFVGSAVVSGTNERQI